MKTLKPLRGLLLVIAVAGFSPSISAAQPGFAMDAWARVLAKYVDEQGRTDFLSLAKDASDLETVVESIAAHSPGTHPQAFENQDAVLAWQINAYNALAMHGVIEEGIPENFDSFFKRAGFFKFRKVVIGGKRTSLYDFENKVIRPLGEARVHFALNCMVRDCPRLPKEPFVAAKLEQQLEAVTREFFSKDKHLRINHDKRRVEVSEILDFYTKDFVASGEASDLVPYINQYRDEPISEDYKVRFIPYDWTINQQP